MHQLRILIIAAAALALAACDKTGSAGPAPDPAPEPAVAAAPPPPAPAAPAAAPATSRPAADQPRITFTSTVHDFGVIQDTEDYFTSFPFTNTGTGTLVISDIKSTCGCTVPTLPKTEFAPGESAEISVKFDPSGQSGPRSKTITVISNAVPASISKLTIQANIRPLVAFSFFLRFGDVELGQAHTRRADMTYSDPDLEFTDIFSTNPHVTAKVIDAGRPNPDRNGLPYMATMEVTLGSDTPWGLLQSTQVKFTAHGRAGPQFAPAAAPYSMWINGQVFGELRIDPVVLATKETFGRGQPFTVSTEMTRREGKPFEITAIHVSKTPVTGLTASVEPKGPGAYTIVLEGTTPAGGGPLNGNVTVTTDVPGEENLDILFALFVK